MRTLSLLRGVPAEVTVVPLLVALLASCSAADTSTNNDAGDRDTEDVADTGNDVAPDVEPDVVDDIVPDGLPDVPTPNDVQEELDTTVVPDAPPLDIPEPPASCGDGAVSGGEACDFSAPLSGCSPGQRCAADCSVCEAAPTAACGDGSLNGTETCDGSAPNDGCGVAQECNATCSACVASDVPVCGDGSVNGEEVCDASAPVAGCEAGFSCNAACTACRPVVVPVCGDGSINGTEICDGSSTTMTGCSAPQRCNDTCSACVDQPAGPTCGDGAINGTEVCDASAATGSGCTAPQVCNATCGACVAPASVCGDGRVAGAEVCDGSATVNGCATGQRCLADCTACEALPVACGDGVRDGAEVCDGTDGCATGQRCAADCSICRTVGCGDGVVSGGELCDATAPTTGCGVGESCAATCDACSVCGDYVVTGSETCDFDGIYGTLAGCAAGQTCSACQCVPERLDIVRAVASGTTIPSMFGFELTIEDTGGFTTFALLFLNDANEVVDSFQTGRDLLVEARRTPPDDPRSYTWTATIHMLFGPPEDATQVYFVIFDEDGVPSLPVAGPIGVLAPPPAGSECSTDTFVPWCEFDSRCQGTPSVCTDIGEVFTLTDFDARRTATGLDITIAVGDDVGDLLPYWLLSLYDTTGEPLGAIFVGFDQEWLSLGGGEWLNGTTIPNTATLWGIPAATIGYVEALIYDSSGAIYIEPIEL